MYFIMCKAGIYSHKMYFEYVLQERINMDSGYEMVSNIEKVH